MLSIPISNTETIADLAKQYALPVVIVAPNRLGTINHTLLTIEAVHNRSLPVAAIILNDIAQDRSTQNLGNAAQIQQHSGIDHTQPIRPMVRSAPYEVSSSNSE